MRRRPVLSALACLALLAGCGSGPEPEVAVLAAASRAAEDRLAAETAARQAASDLAAAEALATAEAQEASAAAEATKEAQAAATASAAAAAAAARAAARPRAAAAARSEAEDQEARERVVEAAGAFDREYAVEKAADVVEDVAEVDERLGDGIAVGGALRLLAGSYGRLASAGTPRGVDEADYQSRLATLEQFAEQAADKVDFGDYSEGVAQYTVCREQTQVLFEQVNKALGTSLRLP